MLCCEMKPLYWRLFGPMEMQNQIQNSRLVPKNVARYFPPKCNSTCEAKSDNDMYKLIFRPFDFPNNYQLSQNEQAGDIFIERTLIKMLRIHSRTQLIGIAGFLGNEKAAFEWQLCCHWLKGLWNWIRRWLPENRTHIKKKTCNICRWLVITIITDYEPR